MATSTNEFLGWFGEWGQVVFFFAQILFWAAIAAAALMIALQYKRFVEHKVAGHAAKPQAETPADPRINIEEFVE